VSILHHSLRSAADPRDSDEQAADQNKCGGVRFRHGSGRETTRLGTRDDERPKVWVIGFVRSARGERGVVVGPAEEQLNVSGSGRRPIRKEVREVLREPAVVNRSRGKTACAGIARVSGDIEVYFSAAGGVESQQNRCTAVNHAIGTDRYGSAVCGQARAGVSAGTIRENIVQAEHQVGVIRERQEVSLPYACRGDRTAAYVHAFSSSETGPGTERSRAAGKCEICTGGNVGVARDRIRGTREVRTADG